MADDVRGTQKDYPKHPEGQFAAVCCDIVDLGQRLTQFPGKPAYLADKFAIVFKTDSEEEVKEIGIEFTNSLSEKGNLLPFLVSWRGRSYQPEELREGVEYAKMVGVKALITVEHKTSKQGRTYGAINGVTKLPKSMAAPAVDGYVRGEYWTAKKTAYAEEVAKWAAAQVKVHSPASQDGDPGPQQDTGEDDLPF